MPFPLPRLAGAALPAALLLSCGDPAPDLQTTLTDLAASHAPHTVGIAYRPLGAAAPVLVHADVVLHAASTMKVPVMIELYRRADAGELDLDRRIAIRNRFASIIDGSPYELTPDDDSDSELYERVGSQAPIRELIRRMIVRSSNLATNILIEVAEPERIQQTIETLGTTRMQVLRGVEDTTAFRAGKSNTATARDLMVLLTAIADGTAASRAACDEMIEVLAAQEFNDMIPSGLPPGTRIAHKTGRITRIRHDAAIVFPAGTAPYVLVVLTKGFDDPADSGQVITEVARIVHDGYVRTR